METVYFLAKLWGFSLTAVSLSLLLNPKHIHKIIEFMEDKSRIIISGVITTVLGIILVLNYNAWEWNWNVIITALGWGVLIKGITRIFFPDFVLAVIEKIKHKDSWMPTCLLVVVLLGCLLVYLGFSG